MKTVVKLIIKDNEINSLTGTSFRTTNGDEIILEEKTLRRMVAILDSRTNIVKIKQHEDEEELFKARFIQSTIQCYENQIELLKKAQRKGANVTLNIKAYEELIKRKRKECPHMHKKFIEAFGHNDTIVCLDCGYSEDC